MTRIFLHDYFGSIVMNIQLMLIAMIMYQMAANVGASQITELKPLYPETPLIHSGEATSVIVAPDDPELREAAGILIGRIQEISGVMLEILTVDDVVSEDWQVDFGQTDGKTLIALGNINNNRLLAVLYGEGYVVADSVYPGKGGYVVRTVHDPFANGFNILVLTGSDPDGVRQAVEVFSEKYLSPASGSIRLKQPITDVKFTPVDLPFLPQPVKPEGAKRQPQYRTAQFYREQLTDENGQIKRIEKGNVLNVFWPITSMAGDKGVTTYKPDGSLMWRYAMGKTGSVLDVGDVDGDGHLEIAAGSEDRKVYLLDTDGHKRWEFECKASVNKAGPPVPVFIQMDDLDGDGEMEIVVGANWVHCLDAQGQLRWEDYLINARGRISGDFRCGAIADFNGDGRRDVLALFYYTYHSGMIFGADGKVVHPPDRDRRKKDGMFKLSLPQCVAAINLLGENGTPHFVMSGDSYLQAYWTSGEHAGQPAGRIPGNFVYLAIHQPPSGPPSIFGGTDMGAVTAVRAGGKAKGASIPLDTLWTSVLGQKISSLWTGKLNDDHTAVMAGTKAGAVFALNAKTGAVLGRSKPTGSPIVKFMDFKDGILALHRDGVIGKIRMSTLDSENHE
jgi:hypothetical protein